MSYRLKGHKIILEGEINKIIEQSLPISPEDGQFIIDSSDKKLKVWNLSESRWIILGEALNQKFDNSSNGFTSTNTQDAIEEAKTVAILKPRFSIVTTFNGTVGNNNWLGYNELLPGNEVPIRIPLNSVLKEVTISYKNTRLLGIPTGSNLIDGSLQIYKNGLTDPTNIIHTETFTNQASGKVISNLNAPFLAGDFLVSKWKDDGDNPSDMAIVYFFQVE